MNIAIRPATLPHDYPAIAAVLKSDNSGAATADELAYKASIPICPGWRGRTVAKVWRRC